MLLTLFFLQRIFLSQCLINLDWVILEREVTIRYFSPELYTPSQVSKISRGLITGRLCLLHTGCWWPLVWNGTEHHLQGSGSLRYIQMPEPDPDQFLSGWRSCECHSAQWICLESSHQSLHSRIFFQSYKWWEDPICWWWLWSAYCLYHTYILNLFGQLGWVYLTRMSASFWWTGTIWPPLQG